MSLRKRALLVLFVFASFLMLICAGCSNHTTKAQREADKAMAQIETEAEKEHDANVKSHVKIQSKSTQKMMRNARKNAKKYNKSLRRK